MINKLHYLIKFNFEKKHSYITNKNSGFTLIELLVAMILAALIITPLLGFMINILDTDRKEQAKVSSEQEIQTALDYIAQDLQQAIYIYDAKGVQKIKNELPLSSASDRVPVLVFWKREFVKEAIEIRNSTTSRNLNDSFVYSLVAYYLIQSNNTNNSNETWSNQFRIARFELKGGILNSDNPGTESNPNYIKEPQDGFALFKLNDPSITGTLEDKMNAWENSSTPNSNMPILVDYVDASQDSVPDHVECDTVFDLDKYPSDKQTDKEKALKVPAFENTYYYSLNTNLKKLGNSSFYACVDVDTVSAKIFLRGNALARINQKDNSYKENRKSYFPTSSVLVKGRGLIGVE